MAKLLTRYLIKNDYSDDNDRITPGLSRSGELWRTRGLAVRARADGRCGSPADRHGVQRRSVACTIEDAGQAKVENPLNGNFAKREFQELWGRINRKAIYAVKFDTDELIGKCIRSLDAKLKVTPLQYTIVAGEQADQASVEALKSGGAFRVRESTTETHNASVHSAVMYDLLGKLSETTTLTRATIAVILKGLSAAVFGQYRKNPEDFINKAGQLINEQKATVIVEHLAYDATGDAFNVDIFTQEKEAAGLF